MPHDWSLRGNLYFQLRHDAAATYELRLRSAGIRVEYASEQFRNDGSIGSSIIKTVKRAMAGEYSRELSVKVFAGQSNLIRLGFRQGGAAGSACAACWSTSAGHRHGRVAVARLRDAA